MQQDQQLLLVSAFILIKTFSFYFDIYINFHNETTNFSYVKILYCSFVFNYWNSVHLSYAVGTEKCLKNKLSIIDTC